MTINVLENFFGKDYAMAMSFKERLSINDRLDIRDLLIEAKIAEKYDHLNSYSLDPNVLIENELLNIFEMNKIPDPIEYNAKDIVKQTPKWELYRLYKLLKRIKDTKKTVLDKSIINFLDTTLKTKSGSTSVAHDTCVKSSKDEDKILLDLEEIKDLNKKIIKEEKLIEETRLEKYYNERCGEVKVLDPNDYHKYQIKPKAQIKAKVSPETKAKIYDKKIELPRNIIINDKRYINKDMSKQQTLRLRPHSVGVYPNPSNNYIKETTNYYIKQLDPNCKSYG
jgi:hypothetical protein